MNGDADGHILTKEDVNFINEMRDGNPSHSYDSAQLRLFIGSLTGKDPIEFFNLCKPQIQSSKSTGSAAPTLQRNSEEEQALLEDYVLNPSNDETTVSLDLPSIQPVEESPKKLRLSHRASDSGSSSAPIHFGGINQLKNAALDQMFGGDNLKWAPSPSFMNDESSETGFNAPTRHTEPVPLSPNLSEMRPEMRSSPPDNVRDARVEEYQTQIKILQQKCDRNKGLENELDVLQRQLDDSKKQNEDLIHLKSELGDEIHKLKAEVREKDGHIATLKSPQWGLQSRQVDLEEKLQNSDNTIKDLREQLRGAKSQLGIERANMDSLESDLHERVKELKHKETECIKLSNSLNRERDAHDSTAKALSNQWEEEKERQEKLYALKLKVSTLQNTVDRQTQELKDADKIYYDSQNQGELIDKYEEQIRELKNDLHRAMNPSVTSRSSQATESQSSQDDDRDSYVAIERTVLYKVSGFGTQTNIQIPPGEDQSLIQFINDPVMTSLDIVRQATGVFEEHCTSDQSCQTCLPDLCAQCGKYPFAESAEENRISDPSVPGVYKEYIVSDGATFNRLRNIYQNEDVVEQTDFLIEFINSQSGSILRYIWEIALRSATTPRHDAPKQASAETSKEEPNNELPSSSSSTATPSTTDIATKTTPNTTPITTTAITNPNLQFQTTQNIARLQSTIVNHLKSVLKWGMFYLMVVMLFTTYSIYRSLWEEKRMWERVNHGPVSSMAEAVLFGGSRGGCYSGWDWRWKAILREWIKGDRY
jgi:hypothetical protein